MNLCVGAYLAQKDKPTSNVTPVSMPSHTHVIDLYHSSCHHVKMHFDTLFQNKRKSFHLGNFTDLQ